MMLFNSKCILEKSQIETYYVIFLKQTHNMKEFKWSYLEGDNTSA